MLNETNTTENNKSTNGELLVINHMLPVQFSGKSGIFPHYINGMQRSPVAGLSIISTAEGANVPLLEFALGPKIIPFQRGFELSRSTTCKCKSSTIINFTLFNEYLEKFCL